MILIDTSVWIDHLRSGNSGLTLLLSEGRAIQHTFVTAELALGSLADREKFIALLDMLPAAPVVSHQDLLSFVTDQNLHGSGLGMVDAHLLASAESGQNLKLWTLDRRLADRAKALGLAHR